jgi:hypothetical protein
VPEALIGLYRIILFTHTWTLRCLLRKLYTTEYMMPHAFGIAGYQRVTSCTTYHRHLKPQ